MAKLLCILMLGSLVNINLAAMKGVKYVCDKENIAISCPLQAPVICIKSTKMVITSDKVCTRRENGDKNTTCSSQDILSFVESKCNGKRGCKFFMKSDELGKHCKGAFKYFTIIYECVRRQNNTAMCSRRKKATQKPLLTLSVPSTQNLNIIETITPYPPPFPSNIDTLIYTAAYEATTAPKVITSSSIHLTREAKKVSPTLQNIELPATPATSSNKDWARASSAVSTKTTALRNPQQTTPVPPKRSLKTCATTRYLRTSKQAKSSSVNIVITGITGGNGCPELKFRWESLILCIVLVLIF